jgi:hypothetical protein
VLGEKGTESDEWRRGKITEMLTRERATCDKCGEEYDVAEGHQCKKRNKAQQSKDDGASS